MPVYFYATTGPHGCLSNFSRHGFGLDGRYWSTVEHYFQAQKFAGTPTEEAIRCARTPRDAKTLGRTRAVPLRADWEAVKEAVMRRGVLAKFEAHADARAVLLATGAEELVENAPGDYIWGCGADGSGQNKLGQILMDIRATLREREGKAAVG